MPPTTPTPSPAPQTPKPSGSGPIFGILIILVMLLVGAFYLWGEHLNQTQNNPPPYIPGDTASSTLD